MKDKPTLDELVAAYRRQNGRIEQEVCSTEPALLPARRMWKVQEAAPSWQSVAAAMATALLILFALPDANACEASAHADRAACMAKVEMILDNEI